MALSPSVEVREFDRTLTTNNIISNASGYVGMFNWGPVDDVVTITTNENELVKKLGRPDSKTALYFHSALNYLQYVNPLLIVRVAGDLAVNAVPTGSTPLAVKNSQAYESAVLDTISFIGRYPGEIANSLLVSVADVTGYDTWPYAKEFSFTPSVDQFNLVVVDEDGLISGTKGTILEKYELLSKTEGTKKPDGSSAYIKKVINDQSNWILVGDLDAIDFSIVDSLGVYEVSLQGGLDDNVLANVDFASGWGIFSNNELYDIMRGFTSGNTSEGIIKAIDVAIARQDMIVFAAPELSDIYNVVTSPENNVVEFFTTTINQNTSYAFYVDNWKQVYDKYSDSYIWIPTDSDAAALHARIFIQNEPWYSPAGLNRGQLKNVIKFAWHANKAQRDILYKNNINSVIPIRGEGNLLFGDKTALRSPSVFSRINVRTLFIVLKKNIAQQARYQLFEFNDFITRSTFKRSVDQYLENVQTRRGLDNYRVVCDGSNNTAQVIDSNEFIADIYIKPKHSINFIRLNFIAVATSVAFEEIEGF